MHIAFAERQYQTENMFFFNVAVTKNFLPKMDVEKHLAPMQFTEKDQLIEYFTKNVNYMMKGASNKMKQKSNFH